MHLLVFYFAAEDYCKYFREIADTTFRVGVVSEVA